MLWLINGLVFGTVVLLSLVLLPLPGSRRREVKARLGRIKGSEPAGLESELQKPFLERVAKPAFTHLGSTLGNLAPREIRGRVEQKLIFAGSPGHFSAGGFIAVQCVTGLLLVAGTGLLAGLLKIDGLRAIAVILLAGLAGLLLPYSLLNARAVKRQREIQRALPDMLDLLLVSVEAGLSFDMALRRVADQMDGILSLEVGRVLDEIKVGKIREEALRGLARRTGVADLSVFISAVIQAEQLGSNIANTLRVQSGAMRHKRRQRAEEAAMKAPIKMLFPLIFFIFPAMFVVLLGPALIRMIRIFQSLL
jgi:tight adherence protein C